MSDKEHCSRCGRCCLYHLNGIEKRCKFLIGTVGKITSCRIYKNRLGVLIDKGKNEKGEDVHIRCYLRKDDKKIISSCTLRCDT